MNEKVSIGLPFYESFTGEQTTQLVQFVAHAAKRHTICDVITSGAMTADHNRNLIAAEFLKSQAEWLFWIDADTLVPVGALERLLSHGRTLVSGLYYGKYDPHPPIAYTVYNGAFTPIDKTIRWERGEIIPVDATGMGCMLTHRSVYEDILANFKVFQVPGGGLVTVHNSDVIGSPDEKHEHDGKVYRGQLRLRLKEPDLTNMRFPFFMIEHIRTEDMYFFDKARRVGHSPVLDTSVECQHLRWTPFTGADYRDQYGH